MYMKNINRKFTLKLIRVEQSKIIYEMNYLKQFEKIFSHILLKISMIIVSHHIMENIEKNVKKVYRRSFKELIS